jgi:acetyl-CoA carboxylase biotin carboxyl carrier protein
MTDDRRPSGAALRARRDPAARLGDHASIDRLTDAVLPRLIGRLDESGLGEIEVREDDWRIRLRRPAPAVAQAPAAAPRAAEQRETRHERPDRVERGTRSAAQHHAAGLVRVSLAESANGNGAGPSGQPIAATRRELIATSPAVGVFQPRPEIRTGSRVRAGDRLAFVDLLGVPQDVVAPVDGVVTRTLVDAGEGVEYGQDLILVEAVAPMRPGIAEGVFEESSENGSPDTGEPAGRDGV